MIQYLACMPRGIDEWFAREILPLEGFLSRYIERIWRQRSDVPDFVQEVYIRVYEAAQVQLPENPKAFLLAAARNLVIDQLRRRQVAPMDQIADAGEFDGMVDHLSPERHASAAEELAVMARAIDSLSEKCREVVWLRRVEGISQRETAQRMGLNEDAVESQLARGIRALARALFGVRGEVP